MFQVQFNGRAAAMNKTEFMTAGSVGIQIGFGFDGAWDGLTKTAVFRGSGVRCDVVIGSTGQMLVPPEVMARAGAKVEVGVYGTNGQGTVVIPTVWVVLGKVAAGAALSGAAAAAITPSLAQQVLAAAEAAQEAAESALGVVQDAEDAAQGAQAAAQAAQAAAENKVITFAVSPNELGTGYETSMSLAKILEAAQVGNTTYYAPLAAFVNPPQSQVWRAELVTFHGSNLRVQHSSDGTVSGSIAIDE